jgi:hypothetical protein
MERLSFRDPWPWGSLHSAQLPEEVSPEASALASFAFGAVDRCAIANGKNEVLIAFGVKS